MPRATASALVAISATAAAARKYAGSFPGSISAASSAWSRSVALWSRLIAALNVARLSCFYRCLMASMSFMYAASLSRRASSSRWAS